MLILVYAALLPRELSLDLAGANLFPYRIALFALAPIAVARLLARPVQPSVIDLFAGFASIWFVLALFVTTTPVTALITGTSLALDFGFAYLIGRAFIRSANDLRTIFYYTLPGLAVVAVILAYESISHDIFLRPLIADILGKPEPVLVSRVRWGLVRAAGPFPHPILGGVFLATILPLAVYFTSNWRQLAPAAFVAVSSFFVVSATAVLAFALAAFMMGAYTVQRISRVPVFLLLGLYAILLYLMLSVVSESGPVSFFVRNFTLDPSTGYYRMLIWQYAGAEAVAHPWVGIGLRDWTRQDWMGDSVDSYWLYLALRYGFPASIASAAVMVGTVTLLVKTSGRRSARDQYLAVALAILLSCVIFSGFSVHLWEGLHTWIIMLCGASVSYAKEFRSADLTRNSDAAPPADKPTQGRSFAT
ncbi:hypothetical protein [Aurantiacibacter gangjinensis]|uniref:hypothetical protein n=1 Tax=Aurantiacibacter gangjinensis TaxID=502682 RepID=UPI00090AB197|nr:hypothetical protein [Aurantiacibacter gangjinensis]APE27339.1 hypothetical protein BMF35_a0510 [Aurantiacibacter gangjinensis]